MLTEPLESRLLLAHDILDLDAGVPTLVAERAFDGRVATFRCEEAVPQDFTAIISWGDGLKSTGMIRPFADRFGVFATHQYHAVGSYPVQVTVYDIKEDTPDSATDNTNAAVTDGVAPFEHSSLRGLPKNLEFVEGQPYSGALLTFADTNPTRQASDYTALIGGVMAADVDENPDGTFSVYGQTPQLFTNETVGAISVLVTAGDEELAVAVPYLVTGAPLSATGRTIPMPYYQGHPTLNVSDKLITFSDANAYSTAADFQVRVSWGDGWVDESGQNAFVVKNGSVYEVRGNHHYRTAGQYPINVQVFEDVHSRTMANSSVTVQEPITTVSTAWVKLYCNGTSRQGTGTPPLEFNVVNQTIRTYATTPRAEAGTLLDDEPLLTFVNNGTGIPTATVLWGDDPNATPETASISDETVFGSHTYLRPGAYMATVTLQFEDSYQSCDWDNEVYLTVPRVRTFVVNVGVIVEAPEPEITATPAQINPSGTVAAGSLFSVTQLLDNAVAMVEWGDGEQTLEEFSGGVLQGQHTYSRAGFYQARVTVRQAERVVTTSTPVNVLPSGGYTGVLRPQDARFAAQEHVNLLAASIDAGQIQDENPRHIGGLHRVDVNWGDGAQSLGQVTAVSGTLDRIRGDHEYLDAGAYPLEFVYQDQFDEVTFGGTAVVSPAPIETQSTYSNTSVGLWRVNWLVGQFQTEDKRVPADHFRALIDWGDGYRTWGEIRGGAGSFAVHGGHLYTQEGSYDVVVFLDDGRATSQAATIESKVHVGEVFAGDLAEISAAEYETVDWPPPSGGGDPPPPPPMFGAPLTQSIATPDQSTAGGTSSGGPSQTLLTLGTWDDVRRSGGVPESSSGDALLGSNLLESDFGVLLGDVSELPGVAASSWNVWIDWDDAKPDTFADVEPLGDNIWSVYGPHLYDDSTYGSGANGNTSMPLELTGYPYGIGLARDLHVASGAFQVSELRPLIYGRENAPLENVKLLTFTRTPYLTGTVTAHIRWGDGETSNTLATANNDNTFTVVLNHTYSEEGQYPLCVLLTSADGVSFVASSLVSVWNADLVVQDVLPYSAAKAVPTGEVQLGRIPFDAWNPPWEGLFGAAATEARAAFELDATFFGTVDWGDGQRSRAKLRLDPLDDALEIYGDHTYGSLDTFDVWVKLEDQSVMPLCFATQVTVIEGWTLAASQRTNGFGEGFSSTIGEAQVLFSTGALSLQHTLDFDISPGTEVGHNPTLVYHSNTAHPRPVVEATVLNGSTLLAAAGIETRLFWNDRDPQEWVAFEISTPLVGNDYMVGAQVENSHPVEQSGIFPWDFQVRVEVGTGRPLYLAQAGQAEVVVQDEGDLVLGDAFDNQPFIGAGWNINLFDRLIVHENGDLLWVDGEGYSRSYERQTDGSYENQSVSDFGELVFDAQAKEVVYTGPDRSVYVFDHLGLLTSVQTPADPPMEFDYDAEGQCVSVDSPDFATVSMDYSGFRLAHIYETGNRTVTLQQSSSINHINDVDGTARHFGYDGEQHLTSDTWGVLMACYQYQPQTEVLTYVNRGLGSVYAVGAVAGAELGPRAAPLVGTAVGSLLDGLGRRYDYQLDSEGRIEHQLGPVGLVGQQERTWQRATSHKSPSAYSGPEGSRTFAYDGTADLVNVVFSGVRYLPDEEDPSPDSRTASGTWTCQRRASVTDENGHTTTTPRNSECLPTQVIDAASQATQLAWNQGRLQAVTNRRGFTTTYVYDSHRRLVDVFDPLGGNTHRTYDAAGNLASERDALGRTTYYFLDARNRLIRTRDANGYDTTTMYDASGLATQTQDANGVVTEYVYDTRGFLRQVNAAVGTPVARTTSKIYDVVGNLTAETDGLNHTTAFSYDALNRRVAKLDTGGNLWTYQYDNRGDLVAESDPLGRITVHAYDVYGYRTGTLDALGGVRLWQYDAKGNLLGSRDAEGRWSFSQYDAMDRRIQATDALMHSELFAYDAEGNLLAQTDQAGRVTQFTYDANNRMTSRTDAAGGVRLYGYDAVGNLTSETDELGHVTVYSYDAVNRRISQINASGDVREFAYDPVGNLIRETDELSRQTEYSYDALRRKNEIENAAHDTHEFVWDAADNLISETDEEGRVTDYQYDTLNRRVERTDAECGVRTYEYDAVGNLLQEVDELGRETSHAYDPLNRRISTTNALNGEREYGYDAVGNLISEADEFFRLTTFAYDDLNRRVSKTDALGGLWTWTYDAVGNVIEETDALNRLTQYTYDAVDRRIETIDAMNHLTTFLYDAAGNLTEEIDAHGHSTMYWYDELNRRTSMRDRMSGLTVYQYDAVGNLVGTEDPLGRVTTYGYDALNRRVETTDAADGVWSLVYDGVGNLLVDTNANGHSTTYGYDGLNRRVTSTNELDEVTEYAYDAVGNLLSETDPLGRVTEYEYNALNRRIQITDAEGHITEMSYDPVGNPVSIVDPLGHETVNAYDDLNRLLTSTDPLDGETQYAYDSVGNRITLVDPAGNVTQWYYDVLNQVTEETNQLDQSRLFTYDALGNLIERTDRNGRVVEYDYDHLNRRTAERWLDGNGATIRTLTFSYDAASQMIGASDPDSAYTYSYDPVGNAETVSHNVTMLGKTISFEQQFDAVGNRTQLLAKINGVSDVLTDYQFDELNRLTQIQQSGTAVPKRVDLTYDAASQFATLTRYADLSGTQLVVQTSYTWDDDSRLTGLAHGTLASHAWTYDEADRLTQTVSPDGTADFSYDDTDQLTEADYSYQTDEAYTFDANGNRTGTGYSTGSNNQTLSDGTYTYEYDNEGNRTRRTKISDGSYSEYTWDHRNRLTKITNKTSAGVVTQVVQYVFDPFNRRIAKVVGPGVGPGTVEHYVYDGAAEAIDDDKHIAIRFDNSGNVASRYLHGASIDQILADEQGTGDVLWPLSDNIGTVRDLVKVVSGTPTVVNHLKYSAFGSVTSETNAAVDHLFGFTGRERDEESGMDYYRARFYDPGLGQFTSEDPKGFAAGDANLHRYVKNGPTWKVDPSGLETDDNIASREDRRNSSHRDGTNVVEFDPDGPWWNNGPGDDVIPFSYVGQYGNYLGDGIGTFPASVWSFFADPTNLKLARLGKKDAIERLTNPVRFGLPVSGESITVTEFQQEQVAGVGPTFRGLSADAAQMQDAVLKSIELAGAVASVLDLGGVALGVMGRGQIAIAANAQSAIVTSGERATLNGDVLLLPSSMPVENGIVLNGNKLTVVAEDGVCRSRIAGYSAKLGNAESLVAPSSGTQSIFKAPQPGKGQKLLNQGFHPEDFPSGGPYNDGKAYFAKERALAEQYSGYGEGILEVEIPMSIYDTRIKPHEVRYLSDPRFTEIPIPPSEFDVLNNALRSLHEK